MSKRLIRMWGTREERKEAERVARKRERRRLQKDLELPLFELGDLTIKLRSRDRRKKLKKGVQP
jgi:hypothetical protein